MTISVKLQNCVYYPTDICFSVQFAQNFNFNFLQYPHLQAATRRKRARLAARPVKNIYTTLVHSVASRLGIIQAS